MGSVTESILVSPPNPSSIERTQSPKPPAVIDGSVGLPTSDAPSECLTFVRSKGRYNLQKEFRLTNSLLASVGLLELANAGDFAANVWNQVPLPKYAIALMAIGGTMALAFPYFAIKDARLSWHNIRGLRNERRYLQEQKLRYSEDSEIIHSLDSLLGVNFRETGTELVDRIGMDILMGFGALVVGVGTYMAIDAAHHSVWLASNYLSGYVGNAPCAVYGLVNLVWSAYVWRRARQHGNAGAKELKGVAVERMLNNRIASVQLHAALNGVTGVVAGAASIITATMWWGYTILAPCIVASFLTNYLWRHRVGYNRPFVRQVSADGVSLVEELKYIAFAQQAFGKDPSALLSRLVSNPESIASVMDFVTRNDLFEDFCIRLLKDTELSAALFGPSNETVTVDSRSLLDVDNTSACRLLEIAKACISERGPTCFKYRERYLLETLGCYMSASGVKPALEQALEKVEEEG